MSFKAVEARNSTVGKRPPLRNEVSIQYGSSSGKNHQLTVAIAADVAQRLNIVGGTKVVVLFGEGEDAGRCLIRPEAGGFCTTQRSTASPTLRIATSRVPDEIRNRGFIKSEKVPFIIVNGALIMDLPKAANSTSQPYAVFPAQVQA